MLHFVFLYAALMCPSKSFTKKIRPQAYMYSKVFTSAFKIVEVFEKCPKIVSSSNVSITAMTRLQVKFFISLTRLPFPAFEILDFLSGSFQDSSGFLVGISKNHTRILQDHRRLSRKSRRQKYRKSKIFHSVSNHSPLSSRTVITYSTTVLNPLRKVKIQVD